MNLFKGWLWIRLEPNFWRIIELIWAGWIGYCCNDGWWSQDRYYYADFVWWGMSVAHVGVEMMEVLGLASLGILGWVRVLENMGKATAQGERDNGPLNVGGVYWVVVRKAIECDKTTVHACTWKPRCHMSHQRPLFISTCPCHCKFYFVRFGGGGRIPLLIFFHADILVHSLWPWTRLCLLRIHPTHQSKISISQSTQIIQFWSNSGLVLNSWNQNHNFF